MSTPSQRDSRHITLLRHLVRAVQRVERDDAPVVKSFELSLSEFDVIATLGNTEGLKMCDVARRTLNSAANVTRIAGKLQARGLLARKRSERSDREVIASLTDAGHALFAAAYPAVVEQRKQDFDTRLSAAEQETLSELLERLA